MTINIIIVLNTKKKNTTRNYLRHVKYVLITTEKKMKVVKYTSLFSTVTNEALSNSYLNDDFSKIND